MAAALLSLKIYALAIVISMAVAILISVIGLVIRLTAGRADRAGRSMHEAPAVRGDTPDENDIAAISAAVYAIVGAHRLVHIEERGRGQTWAAAGRSVHHASHAPMRQGSRAPPPERKR